MKKKITALLLSVLLICSLIVPVSAEMEVDARDSVVVVTTWLHLENGQSQVFGQGTGFFINDQYLITNYHVIEEHVLCESGKDITLEFDEGEVLAYSEVRVYFSSNDSIEAFLVGYNEETDIAVLKLDKATSKRTPLELLVPTEDMVGKSVYAVGYPGLADTWWSRATESWDKEDASVTSGTISRLYTQSGTGQQNVQTDCDIKPGNSGGPVVNSDGHAIGVATWSVTDTGELNAEVDYAVNISEVISLLHIYGINYTMASTEPDPTEPKPTEPPVPVQTEPDNTLLFVIIGVVAALAVIGLVVFFVMKSKKNKTAETAAAAVAVPVLKPVIRSYAQANYGLSVAVGAQPVLIGRNNVCALRFPANTPGISGSHCSVQWDPAAQSFIVTDLNSTYGSYLMSGQRMQPNMPYRLRAGDRFYLGEQGNVISLNME